MAEVAIRTAAGAGILSPAADDDDREQHQQQPSALSFLDLLLTAVRRSMVSCSTEDRAGGALPGMEIGWPTDVRHVAHVTFDRLQGFLGLPDEFQHEIAGSAPSASASVFGVSAESMQCGYDGKGNSVPKILLLMQERLYAQGGLTAEGIFRITPDNAQEETVRAQLNRGVVPPDIDVHCLASLIKAWFRELPGGVLDALSPEQVLQCGTEEDCIELVMLLRPTQYALLNWAVELMADVVEEEEANKMNARNVAMVFAPNMTQMLDPLTALMHAVQVMNFLKMLVLKTLRERREAADGYISCSSSASSAYQLYNNDDDAGGEIDDGEYESDRGCNIRRKIDKNHRALSAGTCRGEAGAVECINYSYSSGDEESLDDIEECFLKRLSGESEDGGADEYNSPCSCVTAADELECQLSFSEYIDAAVPSKQRPVVDALKQRFGEEEEDHVENPAIFDMIQHLRSSPVE